MEDVLDAEDKWTTAKSLNVHYLDWGNPSAPAMLLLHGLCGNAHYWDFFAQRVRQDYHVLVPDLRGHGDSSWAASYGPRDYVLDLEAFVDEIGMSSTVLVGHSISGITAIAYAARQPDRVSKLTIVDIGPEIAAVGAQRLQEELARQPETFDSEEKAIAYMKLLEPRQSDTYVQQQVKYALKTDDLGRLRFKHDRALCDTQVRSPEWLWEYLEQVVCPTLVVHGVESDMLLAEVALKMRDKLPFGSTVDIEGAGHSVPRDNPKGFEVVIRRFLSSGLAPPAAG